MPDYLVTIPTYWTHPGGRGEVAVIYGHPTSLDQDGTLRATLLSLAPFAASRLTVAVVAVAAHPSLAEAVETRVRRLLDSPPLPYPVLLFGASHLQALQNFLMAHGREEHLPLLGLEGYAPVRNLTLILANLCQAEALVSLDDDAVVTDPHFFDKITGDLAELGRERALFGLAGIYQNQAGGVLLVEPEAPCALHWPKFRWLNEAFERLILTGPRIKPTPLAFGGNLILPAALTRRIPFDPALPRGEDVDYVLNARCFGIPFFLDSSLAVVHQPPTGSHPVWLRLRQDLVRFAYTRLKLRGQSLREDLTPVTADELMPYPGNFLTGGLDLMAYRAHTLLAQDYLAAGDAQAAAATLHNLALLERLNRTADNVFTAYLRLQSQWQELLEWLADPDVAARAREAIWGQA
jgi:hypothetical protein